MLEAKRQQPRLDVETIREIEQFLYREARLLDERRFHEWLELLADDVHYWMPMKSNRYPKHSKAIKIADRERDVDREVTREDELALLDETKATLERRVARLDTGMAWAEDPPSRTRHLITNVEVEGDLGASEVTVYSNFVVYRTRAEREEEFYVGSRQDVLRRTGDSWKVARRKIVLDQNVLLVKNVSIFF
ncbi:MAG TPA: 3-phenylpropionate/cinnamic acid dioxygenase subunit beta [Candidatus Elarobacter sp.]|nr:3-phenylpropionate/cinnamic acid dioxygenase subunit beta [Candidatus Elarobacter sp.]